VDLRVELGWGGGLGDSCLQWTLAMEWGGVGRGASGSIWLGLLVGVGGGGQGRIWEDVMDGARAGEGGEEKKGGK
jgi:hypothetical protein